MKDGCVAEYLFGAHIPQALPVETVKRYELIVNLETAREIGVTISPAVLERADQVID
jgi:putative tryptophan/tyrosine transport system substrate-binding protein